MLNYPEVIRLFLHIGIVFLAITMLLCLIRAVRGPKLADRVVATNMICVKTILLIVMVAIYLGEDFLVDVALVYSLLSFLAVVVLTRFMLKVKTRKTGETNKAGKDNVTIKQSTNEQNQYMRKKSEEE